MKKKIMKEHFYSEWPIDYPVPIFDLRTDWHIVLYLKMSHKEIRSQSYKHIMGLEVHTRQREAFVLPECQNREEKKARVIWRE